MHVLLVMHEYNVTYYPIPLRANLKKGHDYKDGESKILDYKKWKVYVLSIRNNA
jgi:hypothetical protein